MPTTSTSLQLFPAKQTAERGKADITIVNHSATGETVTTNPVMLSGGCHASKVTGVHLVSKIHLNPGQAKTVHVTISPTVHGQLGIIFTPKLDVNGFTQVGSLGAKIQTDAGQADCVQPQVKKPVADSHSPGGIPATAVLVCLLGVVFLITAAVLVSRRHRGSHRARL